MNCLQAHLENIYNVIFIQRHKSIPKIAQPNCLRCHHFEIVVIDFDFRQAALQT